MPTFKEKYIDLTYDWNLLMTLCTEFVCTTIFNTAIMTLGFLQMGAVGNALLIFFIAAVVIYAFGPRSGAPFNPAIVLGLMCGLKMNLVLGLLYIVVEFLGGLLAGAFFIAVVPNFPDGRKAGSLIVISPGALATNLAAIAIEMIACFILVLIVFRVAAAVKEPQFKSDMSKEEFSKVKEVRNQISYKKLTAIPLAIAAALGFLSFPTSYISGGAYNPSRALGGCVAGANCSDIWIYFIGDFVGGALAGIFHYWVFETPHVVSEEINVENYYSNEADNL